MKIVLRPWPIFVFAGLCVLVVIVDIVDMPPWIGFVLLALMAVEVAAIVILGAIIRFNPYKAYERVQKLDTRFVASHWYTVYVAAFKEAGPELCKNLVLEFHSPLLDKELVKKLILDLATSGLKASTKEQKNYMIVRIRARPGCRHRLSKVFWGKHKDMHCQTDVLDYLSKMGKWTQGHGTHGYSHTNEETKDGQL